MAPSSTASIPGIPPLLTILNLSPRELTLSKLERFPTPPGRPAPPSLSNLHNVANLTHNITSLLSKTAIGKTPVQQYLPAAGPETARLERVPTVPAIWTREGGDYKVPPNSTRTPEGEGVEIRLWRESRREVLRITFEADNFSRKYFVDVNPQATGTSRAHVTAVTDEEGRGAEGVHYTATWHHGKHHLTLASSGAASCWMRGVPGHLPLSALSLPGTHNSAAHFTAAPSVRCQTHSVAVQLERGVRFLDVRAQPDLGSSTLWLAHGSFPVALAGKQYLDRLLEDTYAFLDRNPSETVVVSLKREGPFEATDEQFATILHDKYVNGPFADKWYARPAVPTLDQARGKCVLVRRFRLAETLKTGVFPDGVDGWGLNAEAWPYNTPNSLALGGNIRVQDFCEVLAATNVDAKIAAVKAHIARAAEVGHVRPQSEWYVPGRDWRPFYVNFLSASNFWNVKVWPEGVAERVNPAVVEYLCTEHIALAHEAAGGKGDAGTGVLVADFVGRDGDWGLVRAVVAVNSVLIVKERERVEREERERVERIQWEEEERERVAEEERLRIEAEEEGNWEREEAERAERARREAEDTKAIIEALRRAAEKEERGGLELEPEFIKRDEEREVAEQQEKPDVRFGKDDGTVVAVIEDPEEQALAGDVA
ncbi:PLC-like phosphodiesterase [Peziza echinospora]|nr:PLC-like phosphodiesterase [Peziza echinospora]